MCSLVGFVGTHSPLKTAKCLILAGMTRGIDAAGYCEINAQGQYRIEKRAGHPIQFVQRMKFLLNPVTWLGHTRKATSDNADQDCAAHPFNGQRFVVFHNGFLVKADQTRIRDMFGITSKNGVDSELFLAFLDKFGNIDSLKYLMLPFISDESRYVLVIYDKCERKVHFIKDAHHPLVYRMTDAGFYYASTAEILQGGIDRRFITFDTIRKFPVVDFPSQGHLIVDICSGKIEKQDDCIKSVAFNSSPRYINAVVDAPPPQVVLDPCSGREIKKGKN